MRKDSKRRTKASSEEVFDWPTMFAKWAEEAPEGALKRYYQSGVVDANTPLENVPMVALDLETTGLNAQQDEIISLGLVPFDHSIIRCQGARYWIAKPKKDLHPESVTIHEITDTELAGAPPLSAILDQVLNALIGKVVVVHCLAIERQFLLEASLKVYGYPLYFPILDTMAIERQVQHKPWWKRFGKAPSLRLDACRQNYRLPRYKAHHALTDALSSAELLQAQFSYHCDKSSPIREHWL